jgi:4-amino-4-deoxy-L-arabinose transferase-like glycosyltransferase
VPFPDLGRVAGRSPAAALAVALTALSLFAASRSSLFDRDEPRFAEAAAEMAASGNLTFATFEGRVRPDKPALTYWLMTLAIRIGGRSEVAVRFWSSVAAAGAALTTCGISRVLNPSSSGLAAMAVLGTSTLVMVEAGAATADSLLLLFTTLALFAFALRLRRSGGLGAWLLLTAALALALLTKGPVGLAIPLVAIAATVGIGRREIPGKRALSAGVLLAASAAVLVFLAWFLPADRAAGGVLLSQGFGRHVLGRALEPMEGHGGGIAAGLPYYGLAILFGFSPWTLFLPGAVSAVAGARAADGLSRAFLCGWALAPVALVSLAATRLPHYILPVFPALALGVGATLEQAALGSLSSRDRLWLKRGVWFYGAVTAVELALLVACLRVVPGSLRLSGMLLAAILAAFGVAAIRCQLAGRFGAAARIVFAGALAVLLAAAFLVLPALERYKAVPPLAREIRTRYAEAVPVATFEFAEPSLDFYLARLPIRALEDGGRVALWAREPGPGVLVTTRHALERLPAATLEDLSEVTSRRGFNLPKGSWVELVVLERGRTAGPAVR